MTFYKFGCQSAMYDTGSYHQQLYGMSQSSAMLSASAHCSSNSVSTHSLELSLASSIVIAGLSIISLVSLLVASIIFA